VFGGVYKLEIERVKKNLHSREQKHIKAQTMSDEVPKLERLFTIVLSNLKNLKCGL
jgi:hypothetical protein